MKTLHSYLTRQVIASLLMTLIVFTFVLLVGNVLREILGLLVNRQATLRIVLEAIGLLIPFVWVFALPMAVLTATLLVFGRFSADHELTAARASGISLLSLITPILLLSLFLCGVSALVNLEVAPRCRLAYKNLLLRLKFNLEFTSSQLPEGRFIKDFPGYILYLGKNRRQNLEDIMIFVLPNEKNPATTLHARHGQFRLDADNNQIVLDLYDVKSITRSGGRDQISTTTHVPVKFNLTQVGAARKPNINDMTFMQLQDELRDLEERMALPPPMRTNGPAGQRLGQEKPLRDLTLPVRVQIHRRVAISFACFGFALVGIPLGIRVHRRETNVSFVVTLLLVMVYYGFILAAQSLATRPEWMPHLIMWLPNFIFQAVGAVLLWRANRGM